MSGKRRDTYHIEEKVKDTQDSGEERDSNSITLKGSGTYSKILKGSDTYSTTWKGNGTYSTTRKGSGTYSTTRNKIITESEKKTYRIKQKKGY